MRMNLLPAAVVAALALAATGPALADPAAMERLKRSAEAGNVASQADWGVALYFGRDVAADRAAGIKWVRTAAEQGEVASEAMLGLMYLNGYGGVDKDYALAEMWLRKAANQDEPVSQNYLGWMYANGLGMVEDKVQALKWMELAVSGSEGDADQANMVTVRDRIAAGMSAADIEKARQLAREWRGAAQ